MDSAYAAAYPDLYRRHWWWRVREALLLRTIASLVGERRPARLLDVGCGGGLFFDALERFGHVEGIESDAGSIAHAGRWRSRIVHGELDASFRPETPYDAILMLDVLEHVPDPGALLRHARPLLAPDGRLLVTVPAFGFLWTAHDDMNHHLRRYTASGLHRTLDAAGFEVVTSTYLFPSLVLPKLAVRALEALGLKSPSVPRVPARPVNAALQTWFSFELAAARWLPFGTSLMVTARVR